MIITLKPGEALTIEFFECDGQFQIHFDTPDYDERIVVRETANLQGNVKGGAGEVLYEESFGQPFVPEDLETS